jgi:hypothetical protein
VFSASSDVHDDAGNVLVTAYALKRPDGDWSLMLVNKDQENPHEVKIGFNEDGSRRSNYFSGPVSMVTFGSEQYQWHSNIRGGIADPDGPAARSTIAASEGTTYTLPKASVSVLRGKLASNLAERATSNPRSPASQRDK